AATFVDSEKLASAELARPDFASLAVHAMLTSLACQTPSALPHEITGGVLSILTSRVFVPSTLLALSVAPKDAVVSPSFEMLNDAAAPATVVGAIVCAPEALYVISFTPEPQVLSAAFRLTVAGALFQPLTGAGLTPAVVVGGTVSGS